MISDAFVIDPRLLAPITASQECRNRNSDAHLSLVSVGVVVSVGSLHATLEHQRVCGSATKVCHAVVNEAEMSEDVSQ